MAGSAQVRTSSKGKAEDALNKLSNLAQEARQVSMNVDLQEWCTRLMARSFEVCS